MSTSPKGQDQQVNVADHGTPTERTIGVAISIPEPYGEMLRAHRAAFGDPQAASVPTHVTLLPPTAVPVDSMDLVCEHLTKVSQRQRPFSIHLRGTATFRPVSPVVFVQLVQGISECELLEKAVRQGPLTRELQFYYHPHVTVAHHLDEQALDRALTELTDFECRFTVTGFHLYQHGQDEVWRTAGWFDFSGDE